MMLSKLTPSRLLRSIMSLLLAKKPASNNPNMPPRPKTQKFLRFLCCPLFLSVCSCSAVIRRKFAGRLNFPSGPGEGSRDSSGVEISLSSPPPPPPKRRLKKDMNEALDVVPAGLYGKGVGDCHEIVFGYRHLGM